LTALLKSAMFDLGEDEQARKAQQKSQEQTKE